MLGVVLVVVVRVLVDVAMLTGSEVTGINPDVPPLAVPPVPPSPETVGIPVIGGSKVLMSK